MPNWIETDYALPINLKNWHQHEIKVYEKPMVLGSRTFMMCEEFAVDFVEQIAWVRSNIQFHQFKVFESSYTKGNYSYTYYVFVLYVLYKSDLMRYKLRWD